MPKKMNSTLSVSVLLGLSMTVHGGLFLSLKPLGKLNTTAAQKFMKAPAKEKLEFEFVEAPPKAHPQAPSKETKKISDRDALSQDLLKDKAAAVKKPAVKTQGPSDQLAQKMARPSQAPAAPSEPRPSVKPAEQKKVSQDPDAMAEKVQEATPQKEMSPKPKSKAQAPLEGLTGHDKIQTQEMAREQSSGAKLFGVEAFEAMGTDMGIYMKNLKEKIWLAWFPYLSFHYPQDYREASAILSILLDRKGNVKMVRILESKGSPHFAAYCMEAVQKASGFGPVPDEILALLGKDELELKFGFHYL